VNSDFVKPIAQLLDLALRIPTQGKILTGLACVTKKKVTSPKIK
jgi:hypothetical protein